MNILSKVHRAYSSLSRFSKLNVLAVFFVVLVILFAPLLENTDGNRTGLIGLGLANYKSSCLDDLVEQNAILGLLTPGSNETTFNEHLKSCTSDDCFEFYDYKIINAGYSNDKRCFGLGSKYIKNIRFQIYSPEHRSLFDQVSSKLSSDFYLKLTEEFSCGDRYLDKNSGSYNKKMESEICAVTLRSNKMGAHLSTQWSGYIKEEKPFSYDLFGELGIDVTCFGTCFGPQHSHYNKTEETLSTPSLVTVSLYYREQKK